MKRKAVIEQNRCAACGACTVVCPKNAITVYKGCYAMAGDNCTGCGKCEKVCPVGCIAVREREQSEE